MNSLKSPPVLAVDLSIWICEALTSSGMKHHHVADPPLQLVYSRVLKLLNLGIQLVVVIEGKRRNRIRKINDDDEGNPKPMQETFRKRRSGAPFWKACERCETMLKLLGVIVVRATAEGEALCALLNQRGIVDGVISNDGDCLLFGAKVLYTKFSVENLDKSSVVRYDANNIRVILDDDDADRFDETVQKSKQGQDVVELSRKDLIAFAILTGSDLAGDGLSKVGCRKAIRFIRKCQIDNPLKVIADGDSSPALTQLLSWEQTAARGNLEAEEQDGPHCGCCGHPGTKRHHKKHGCKGCGTNPGEPCFPISPGGRFRKMLRQKALSMKSSFDPSSTLRAYYEPNDDQIPFCLLEKTARTLRMNSPQIEKLLELPFVIRGRTFQENREFVQKSLSSYLARQELLDLLSMPATKGEKPTKLPRNNNRPTPVCVNKLMVRSGKPSCQVQWKIKATTSDADGNPLHEFEFCTIEDESVIKKCYPKLLQEFQEEQKKLQQQGTAEQEKRRNFLLSMEQPKDGGEIPLNGTKNNQTRKDYFDQTEVIPKVLAAKKKGYSDDVEALLAPVTAANNGKKARQYKVKTTDVHSGRVVSTEIDGFRENLLAKSKVCRQSDDLKNLVGDDWIDDTSTICTDTLFRNDNTKANPPKDYFRNALLPGHEHYLGIESVFEFRCMAGDGCHPQLNVVESNSVQISNREKKVLERKASSEKVPAVDSICRNLFPHCQYIDKRTPCCEFEHIKKIPHGYNTTFPAANEGFLQLAKEVNHGHRHCKHRVSERNAYINDNRYHDQQAVLREEYPRARISTSHQESSKPTHVATEFAIHVDREDEGHLRDRSEPGKDASEFCIFDFLPHERKSYEQTRSKNPRKRDRDRHLENGYNDKENVHQKENLCGVNKTSNAREETKMYRSTILQDVCQNAKREQRGPKLRKKKHPFGVRNKRQNKGNSRKEYRSYSKRDEHRYLKDNIGESKSNSFDELHEKYFVTDLWGNDCEFEAREDTRSGSRSRRKPSRRDRRGFQEGCCCRD